MKITHFLRQHWVYVVIVATTIVTYLVSAELEAFEWFYEYSRAHEDWDLDEIAMLVLNLVVGLSAAFVYRSVQLRRALGERDLAERRATDMARHDALTGLANRRAMNERMAEISQRASEDHEHFMMLIDLDRFKTVNDVHGHATGDEILQQVAQRLTGELAEQDFAVRLGGDEFAVLVGGGTTASEAERTARRVLRVLSAPYETQAASSVIGASIGLASIRARELSEDALGKADRALYSAKRSGRGRVAWYDEELDAKARERAELEADLRTAIANGDIVPYFHPIVSIDDGLLKGFEVLARWPHETRGLIPPDQFIEIAEDIGQISVLGWSILRRACEIGRLWPDNLSISVNVSPYQFRDEMMVATVRSILEETDFDPARLEIEITESAVMVDVELAKAMIDQLRALGIRISLDDFGTGFSSLSNLRQLPFDRIKIDRSFVSGLDADPSNQKIVSGILALANGLELSVTAEGIESESDLDALRSMNCELGQGYHYARPMPADEIAFHLETDWSSGQTLPATAVEHAADTDRAASA